MNSERIKEIQAETAYPQSRSVHQALLKVWNECEQQQDKKMYSEEELHNAFYNGWLYRGEEKYKFQFPKAKKEWFEQFNK